MEERLDIRERGGVRNGEPQLSDKRLFMQLLAFGECDDPSTFPHVLSERGIQGVLYKDMNDPRGIGLLTWSDDPNFFIDPLRLALNKSAFAALHQKLEYSMLGRTYSLGHEPNLEDWLLEKPKRAVTDPESPWAIWYPLRRRGEFSALPPEEQAPILREHGKIGHSFGEAGFAQDIRLACFGLDKNDNDFIIGLTGKDLYALSACIQAMRRTKQTSRYIEAMGPFFVGKAFWQSAG
jgi:hypothetical protein